MARDLSKEGSKIKVRRLIAMEPPGLVDKMTIKQLFDFGVVEGVTDAINAEVRIKSVVTEPFPTVQKGAAPLEFAPSLSRLQFTPEDLAEIKVDEFQIWFGGDSSVTGPKAIEMALKVKEIREKTGQTPLEVVIVDGAGHDFPFTFAEGVTDYSIGKDAVKEGITHFNQDELDNSAVRNMIRRAAA
jgi:hypothetical protein